jgi:hypothetical protein
LEIVIKIRDDPEILDSISISCGPDNDVNSQFTVSDGVLAFRTTTTKVGNIYSLSDEILKCYDLVKKIYEEDYS